MSGHRTRSTNRFFKQQKQEHFVTHSAHRYDGLANGAMLIKMHFQLLMRIDKEMRAAHSLGYPEGIDCISSRLLKQESNVGRRTIAKRLDDERKSRSSSLLSSLSLSPVMDQTKAEGKWNAEDTHSSSSSNESQRFVAQQARAKRWD